MDVTYKNRHLQKCAENESYSVRKLGKLRSDLFLERVGNLMAAVTLEDVRLLPGDFHELSGDKKGQWACRLDNPYRLILKGVEILEIENYHGK